MLVAVLRSSRTWRLAPLQLAVGACTPVRPRAAVAAARFVSTPSGSGVDGKNLDQEGKQVTNKTRAWEKKIVAALQAYKEVHGDTLVPIAYEVPFGDERWPRETWGYRLGVAVNDLRKKMRAGDVRPGMEDELDKLGFVTNVSQYNWDTIIMPALRHFHELHSHTDVPQDFVVPTGDASWPEPSWRCKLGITVTNIRSKNVYAVQVEASKEELRELFFCHELTTSEREWREMVLPSLTVFRDEFHHCIVDPSFKVPAMHPWPEKVWNMPLGRFVNMIRPGKIYVEQSTRDRDVLDELGFAWDRDLATYNELIIPSLEVYVAQHGTCEMSQKFVVPECDPWPRPAWGMRLGHQLYHFKKRGYYFAIIGRDVERLGELGFSFELMMRAWKLKVVPLLETYESLFGDRHVPQDFVVPSESPWPKELWGVWLGYLVARNSRLL